ncbi:MAG: 50S ribosomal protein L30 [Clostridia bacterium]|nr:50S ribosomal protein L30 [Clostridia bacterium]
MDKQIKVTLVKSLIGRLENQKANVAALGLSKIGDCNVFPATACTRGMIRKVSHMVKVEEI